MDLLLINTIQKNNGLSLQHLGYKRFQLLAGWHFISLALLFVYFDEAKWKSSCGKERKATSHQLLWRNRSLSPRRHTFMTLNKYPMCWIFFFFPYESILHPAQCSQWMISMVSIMGFLVLWLPLCSTKRGTS